MERPNGAGHSGQYRRERERKTEVDVQEGDGGGVVNMRWYDRQITQILFLDAEVCLLHIFVYPPKYLVLNSEDPFPSENGFYKVILDSISVKNTERDRFCYISRVK